MSHIDTARNLLHARIVYWGPSGSGKTTTLASLRGFIDPAAKLRLYSIAAADGATLFFDLLPVEEFTFGAHRVRARVLAVCGRVDAAEGRRALLEDADAVVFVAGSGRDALEANVASAEELRDALQAMAVPVPVVWCFNKQDRPDAVSADELRPVLCAESEAAFETVATDGTGVFESFSEAFRLMTAGLADRHDIVTTHAADAVPARMLPQLVRGVSERRAKARDGHVVIRVPGAQAPGAAQVMEAQLRLLESHSDVDTTNRMLEARNRDLMAVNRVARSILSAMEVDNLLVVLLDVTADFLHATHASCVVFDPAARGSLKTHVLGFGRDPALGLAESAARGFFDLMQNSDGPIPVEEERNGELLHALHQVDRRVERAIFQPIKSSTGRLTGWIGIYTALRKVRPNTQELLFLSSISRLAALGMEKIGLLDTLQRARTTLQGELQELTGKMEMANARIRALNRGLESRVTERTGALEEANRTLREKSAATAQAARIRGMGNLAASFAHEVNNPLAGLQSNVEFMRDGLDDLRARVAVGASGGADALKAIEEFEEVIGECAGSVQRISGMIASLKRFGGEEEPAAKLSLNAVVADAVALLEERIRGCGELELRLGNLPDVEGEALELSHVVLALLTNAIEAVERTGNPGKITIASFADGDRVTLLVKDTGDGIGETLLERVFEPFVSTKEGEPSAGLGLHCALQVVERHDGRISIRSKTEVGTTVKVELPLTQVLVPAGGGVT